MAVGIVAHIKVLAGKEAEFEREFAKNAELVRANEPGNQLYQLFKSRENTNEYIVMEIYDDQAAFEAHAASAHFQASRPVMLPLREGKPRVEIFDAA